jgi:hypothetical protein
VSLRPKGTAARAVLDPFSLPIEAFYNRSRLHSSLGPAPHKGFPRFP